jgi:hypothetical protein
MVKQIDHIVIGVRDLAAASADYECLGFTVTPGGEHTGGATRNALVSFRDGSYFELIAFTEPDRPQPHRWWSRVAKGEGLVDFALLSKDLLRETARLTAASVQSEPRDGGRVRPDGEQIAWKSASLASTPPTHLPFVIEDVTPRQLRVPNGPATAHPLGVTGIAGVSVVVEDLAASAPAYAALLETEGEERRPTIDGARVARRYAIGPQWIELIQPASGGQLATHLADRGEGPYEIVLNGAENRTLPLDVTHGARLRADSAAGD